MAGYENECLTEHDLEERYGNLYALVKKQMPEGNYTINVGQMQKVMRIVVFFDSVMECEGGSWQKLQFDSSHNSFVVSMAFLYFDEDSRMAQMCRAFGAADEFVIYLNSTDTFCVECRVYNVLDGIVENLIATQPVPTEMLIEEEYRVREMPTEEQAKQFCVWLDGAIKNMLLQLDDSDYIRNIRQFSRFTTIFNFLEDKADELGGKVNEPELVPKECVGRMSSAFPRFELKGDDVKEFFYILEWANTWGISSELSGNVTVDINVPDVFVHK